VGDVARALYADLRVLGVGAGYDELHSLLVQRGASTLLLAGLAQAEAEWSQDLRLVAPQPPRQRVRDRGLGGF
jgi:hypothetical protein